MYFTGHFYHAPFLAHIPQGFVDPDIKSSLFGLHLKQWLCKTLNLEFGGVRHRVNEHRPNFKKQVWFTKFNLIIPFEFFSSHFDGSVFDFRIL